jgi:transposase
MLPTLQTFMTAYRLSDITVVADAGMLSENNKREIEAAGLGFILGNRISHIPYVIDEWRTHNPGVDVPDGLTLTQPWPGGPNSSRRDQVIYYQYRHDRARRARQGIDEQVSKAEKAVTGKAPTKRNRFITLAGGNKTVNRELEAKARTLAGWKSYITNINRPTPEFVIDAYHQLWRIEKSFRMSKHDLRARPIYHHKRESIEAHLAVVFAALAVTHDIEHKTGWSIKRFVQTARRYHTIAIRAGDHVLTAEEPLPTDLRDALALIT